MTQFFQIQSDSLKLIAVKFFILWVSILYTLCNYKLHFMYIVLKSNELILFIKTKMFKSFWYSTIQYSMIQYITIFASIYYMHFLLLYFFLFLFHMWSFFNTFIPVVCLIWTEASVINSKVIYCMRLTAWVASNWRYPAYLY